MDAPDENENHVGERVSDRQRRLEELIEALLIRLAMPIEVSLTIHVVNDADPAVKLILTPETPQPNPKENT